MDCKKIGKTNKIFFPFLIVIMVCSMSVSVFAYEIPDNSYKMTVNSNVGDVVLVVPYNVGRYLSLVDGQLVSQYSSTVTLYGNTIEADNSQQISVRLQPFLAAEYRYSDYTNTYSDFVINEIVDSNVPFLQETDFTLFSQDTMVNMIVCLVLGAIIVLMLKKR